MTSDVATQDLQSLLRRQGWQDLVEMVVAIVKHGLPLTDIPPPFANAATHPTDRISLTRNAAQHLLEILQETSSSDSSQINTREVDKRFCDELGRVIELIESLHGRGPSIKTPHRPRDSGTFVGTGYEARTTPSLQTNQRTDFARYDGFRAPFLQSSLPAPPQFGAYTNRSSLQMGRPRSIAGTMSPSPNFHAGQLAPTSPTNLPINLQKPQETPPNRSETDRSMSEQPSASNVQPPQSPSTTDTGSSSGSSAESSDLTVSRALTNATSPGAESSLRSEFKLRPPKFFKVGRVLMVLWSEPQGDEKWSSSSGYSEHTFIVAYGERVQAKIRRFIIFDQREHHSLALPILTYTGRGVGKKGVNKAEHGIIYTDPKTAQPFTGELPQRNEKGMVPIAIRVTPDEQTVKLAAGSRINYGKIYTIEHNVKVARVGMVHDSSLHHFHQQRTDVLLKANPSLLTSA